MIPLQLKLKNFLSYREATLEFEGLHTACICGANGAGKSSLLEAITWALWGESRAATEDDTINAGANEARVDFEFINGGEVYRVVRCRPRGKTGSLDLQIKKHSQQYLSLTGKTIRDTQKLIVSIVKLDYKTFINSAYLRQGRADEFMLSPPSERKKILADLLELDKYEQLSGQAKDLSKQYRVEVQLLEQSLEPLQEKIQQREEIEQARTELGQQMQIYSQQQQVDQEKLQQLQAIEHQRQTWEQQLVWQQTQLSNATGDCDRLKGDLQQLQQQLRQLQQQLQQKDKIERGYQHLQQLNQEEERLGKLFHIYQQTSQAKQQIEQELAQQANQLELKISGLQSRKDALIAQEKSLRPLLAQDEEITAAVEKLHYYQQRLQDLDRLHQQVSPLIKQRQSLQTDLDRAKARINAQLEQLHTQAQQYQQKIKAIPQVRNLAIAVHEQIASLDKQKNYLKRIEEKNSNQKSSLLQLIEQQNHLQQQIQELQQKLDILQNPHSTCPLCEQSLEGNQRQQVIDKTQAQQEQLEARIWLIRGQIKSVERDLQALRLEADEIKNQLSDYDQLQQKSGQLEAQFESTSSVQHQLQQIRIEIRTLEQSLTIGNYAQHIQSELQQIDLALKRLDYDEETHGLVRGEAFSWRWADKKHWELERAKKSIKEIESEKPKLEAQLAELERQKAELYSNSPLQQQLDQTNQRLQQLGYDRTHHDNMRTSIREAQVWIAQYQQLKTAQEQYPQLQQRKEQLEANLAEREANRQQMQQQFEQIRAQREQIDDCREQISQLERQIHQRRQQLDRLIAETGRLDQSLAQIDTLQAQYEQTITQLEQARKQYRIHEELGKAFGKNGIQALMIENILPQLEAETNQILVRLTGNQLHVQFLTQKAGRSSRKRKNAKLIDTLDIAIADARGTRAYETYSGGEAFRINFSIRLALAKLLAQRAGTSLQMLIIDEGFGTQDNEGCDRLIAAINAIAADFRCILTVTHMPQFKEAFQTRIEVYKTEGGSCLTISE